MLNIVVWTGVAWYAGLALYIALKAEPRERFVTSATSIRIERQAVLKRQLPRSPPQAHRAAPAQTETPSLSLPSGWSKQDIGNEGAQNAVLWLDWKRQTAEFVPRVFLWQRQVTAYERRPSLRDAVEDVVTNIRGEGDKLYASRPEKVCNGTRPGWFLSYDKPEDDPPIHIDDTLYVAGDTIYRATYVRPAGQPEDTRTRRALNSLC